MHPSRKVFSFLALVASSDYFCADKIDLFSDLALLLGDASNLL